MLTLYFARRLNLPVLVINWLISIEKTTSDY